jgi:hypothetical protein
MTRLRPIVVPIAALTLATATPSANANAQPRRPVALDTPLGYSLAAKHADLPPLALAAQPASSLLHAVLEPPGEAAVPDGRRAVAAPPAAVAAPGRPTPHSARGPP